MQVDAPETAKKADIDPNDWDSKESVFEFIHREFGRLSPKIPSEFEATGFRISFIATTDKPEYPIETYFTVAMRVTQIGEVKMVGRNPSEATIRLIDGVYKEYAKLIQQENAQRRHERNRMEAQAQEYAARQSLLDYSPQEIADIIDGHMPLPAGVTVAMVEERSRKIAIETVRGLRDNELEVAKSPSFLSTEQRESFALRCASELRCRGRVRQILDAHQQVWKSGEDDYAIILQIWRLCARQAKVLDEVLTEFFSGEGSLTGGVFTLERLLRVAPEVIRNVRRTKGNASREADRLRREERDEQYQQSRAEMQKLLPARAWSKTSAPY